MSRVKYIVHKDGRVQRAERRRLTDGPKRLRCPTKNFAAPTYAAGDAWIGDRLREGITHPARKLRENLR